MGFGIIVMLIIVLGAISWQQTDKIEQHTMDMYNHPFTVRKALGRLNVDILEMRLEFRNFLLAHHDKDREAALVNSQFYETDAELQFQILGERYLGPQTDINEAREAFVRWVAIRKGNRELGMSGKITEVMDRLEDNGDIGRERENLLKCIYKIDQFPAIKPMSSLWVPKSLKISLTGN